VTPEDDDLLDRALEDRLDPADEEALAARLTNEPDLARRYVERSRDEALLGEGVAGARATRGLDEPPRSGVRPVPLLAALGILGALAVWFLLPAPPREEPAAGAVPAPPIPAAASAVDFGSGRGLRAEYFDNDDLTNLRLERIDPAVDFAWGFGSPHPSIEADTFSVRWRGQIEPLYSEPTTFHVVSDDGARLWIDGRLVVDDWTIRGTRELAGTAVLEAGRRHELRLEYLESVSTARVSLLWSSPSLPMAVVPPTRLFPASSGNHLLEETFSKGLLAPGTWIERLDGAVFEPGALVFPHDAKPAPSLLAAREVERKPGLCLAVGYRGNVHRGKPEPFMGFDGGPGWSPGQRQGRHFNTAAPLGATPGYPIRNDNLDTLFLVVLREHGAFHLVSAEPDCGPDTARLVRVSSLGGARSLRPVLRGGAANARFTSLVLTDLGGEWSDPWGPATFLERFKRDRPERGGTPWASGLSDAGTPDGTWELEAAPGPGTTRLGLIVRAKDAENHLRFEMHAAGTRLMRRREGIDEEVPGTAWREAKLRPGVPVRLSVRCEGPHADLYVDDVPAAYGFDFGELDAAGTKIGVLADGDATLRHLAGWPARVTLPPALAAKLPPVPLAADGDVVVHDDFEAPDGTPLEGRAPKIGRHPWVKGLGTWTIRGGAAAPDRVPAHLHVDCGRRDVELRATIAMPEKPAAWPKDWFPAIHARCSGPGAIEPGAGINARFLWQGGSNEIEVWDRPADTPELRARWAGRSGRILTELINATNITPMIRPGRTHVLKVVVRGSRVSYFCDERLVGTADTRVADGTWVGLNVDAGGDPSVRFLDFTVRAFR
jgi:hypothetical protein